MTSYRNSKIVTATKWSAITEIAAKLVSPISTMVLARLLTPDAFGVLVTVTMVISFAEIFTDAGFQKYIIQHEFKDDKALYKSTTVAFWSNFCFSIFLWTIIALFSKQIAHVVGNDGYGLVIAISCVCIPLEAFSSIQMALFKRQMDFKTLFTVRIVGILIPLIITIPLAYMTHSYWSLVIGMIALNISNALLLTLKSSWKPNFFYSIKLFKEMFSFTMWSMIEAISIWLTGYLDVFIVGTILSTYYMGLYRTSINTVGGVMAIITSTTTPILFSALSRLQNDKEEFKKLFFNFQKIVSILVVPLGFGIFLFRRFVTGILLGDQWMEASNFIGWWALFGSINIVLSYYCSEVFRSLGRPKLSVIAQLCHLLFLIPTVLASINYGFDILTFNRSAIRLTMTVINLILLYYLTKITAGEMLRNVFPSFLASFVMVIVFYLLPPESNTLTTVLYVFICVVTYLVFISFFQQERGILFNFKSSLFKK